MNGTVHGRPVGLGSDLRGAKNHYAFSRRFEELNRRLAELTRQYTAIRKGDPRALAIAEELAQVGTVRDEIQRIQEKLGRSGLPPRCLPSESPTVETLL